MDCDGCCRRQSIPYAPGLRGVSLRHTAHDVVCTSIFTSEYDAIADFPPHPFWLLTPLNSLAVQRVLHASHCFLCCCGRAWQRHRKPDWQPDLLFDVDRAIRCGPRNCLCWIRYGHVSPSWETRWPT
ncbi:PE-PPE domain-containing protein [Mycobacterium stomatepiae]|nr:PE-PPE domain-containing protein [Mycobacterium stomatepiae]